MLKGHEQRLIACLQPYLAGLMDRTTLDVVDERNMVFWMPVEGVEDTVEVNGI